MALTVVSMVAPTVDKALVRTALSETKSNPLLCDKTAVSRKKPQRTWRGSYKNERSPLAMAGLRPQMPSVRFVWSHRVRRIFASKSRELRGVIT